MKLSYRNEQNARYIAEQYKKPLDKPDWYKIENVAKDEAEILVYDYIGWPYNDAREFVAIISRMTQSKITIRINSPGGDVFDAHAIYNAIKAHPSKPITIIESLAASAASYIAVAGHEKQAYKNAMIMIHEPMSGMWGNQHELREVADILAQINTTMVDMYADNTNIGKKDIKDMLKAETWMSAKAAKGKGFVDTIIEAGKPVNASFDLSMFANCPDEFKPQKEPTEPNIRNCEGILRDVGGLSVNQAKAVLARGWKAIGDMDIDTDSLTESAKSVLKTLKGNR
jgi:ATP-dependent Clp endopeptidase proteolytic subunit ClpP